MVGADGSLPLPWLRQPLERALSTLQGHAVLVHGAQGMGQFDLALALAQGWLCEAGEGAQRPCGRCAGCRLVQAHGHPDLMVLLPEALRGSLGWEPVQEGADAATSAKARPSQDIKVDAVRAAVAFAQTTSARGVGKVLVVHPAERMNIVAANTLLKTLEEPPGMARFVLCAGSPDGLLPTLRSRCQALAMTPPPRQAASEWLAARSIAQPEVLLDAAGGQPLAALELARDGIDAVAWAGLPARLAAGDTAALAAWPLPRVIETLQKLCHDALRVASGGAPRYFPAAVVPRSATVQGLGDWAAELKRIARYAEHPWSVPLALDALVQQARQALSAPAAPRDRQRTHSVHSAR